jgi:hypothetical protein
MSDYNFGLYTAFQARDLMDFAVAGYALCEEINKLSYLVMRLFQSLRKIKKQ